MLQHCMGLFGCGKSEDKVSNSINRSLFPLEQSGFPFTQTYQALYNVAIPTGLVQTLNLPPDHKDQNNLRISTTIQYTMNQQCQPARQYKYSRKFLLTNLKTSFKRSYCKQQLQIQN